MESVTQLCTFVVGDMLLGIEVQHVQEVLKYLPMTSVPLAHPVVSGLINLRGQIVTAIDLRRRLDVPERTGDRPPMNVVVNTEDGTVSFLVDEIGDVIEVGDDAFERPPDTVRGSIRELIRGVYKLKGKLLLVLDAESAAHVESTRAA